MTRRDHVRLTDIVEKKLFYVERVGRQAPPLRHVILIYIAKIAAVAMHPPSCPPLNLRLFVTDCGFERCGFVTRWYG